MNYVTVSTKFQVMIPKEVRESLNLKPGTKLIVTPYLGRIEMVPVKPMRSLFGSLKGMDTTIIRDDDRIL